MAQLKRPIVYISDFLYVILFRTTKEQRNLFIHLLSKRILLKGVVCLDEHYSQLIDFYCQTLQNDCHNIIKLM